MNKKAFLKAYQDVKKLDPKQAEKEEPEQTNSLYRSQKDEELIKSYHFAKFQKNRHQAQNHPELQSLVEKEDWDDEDTKKLLKMMR